MSVASFIPTIWYSKILTALNSRLVGEAFVNHDVEGEALFGGSVKINSIGKATIKDYQGQVVYSDASTTAQTLNIDKQIYDAVKIDDVDAAQCRNSGEIMSKQSFAIGVGIAEELDKAIFTEIAGAATSANTYGDDTTPIAITDGASAKKVLLKLKSLAERANVPVEGRRVACPPDFESALLADPYINIAPPTAEDTLKAGYVGKLYGMEIYSSNNIPQTDGNNDQVILSHPMFTTEVNQLKKVEALRLEGSFSDAIRYLDVSGVKTVIPEGVMKAVVNFQ